MENKKIAYIILSKNHRSDFKKGFLNKSLCLAGNVTDMPYAWKASDLMDERLQKRGIVVCLNGSGELCDKTSLSIEEICRKENISGICLGEAEIAENYFSLPVFNGSISAFKANAAKVFENETVLQLCGIVADDDTDYAYFDYLAPKVGSIYLYGQSRSVASARCIQRSRSFASFSNARMVRSNSRRPFAFDASPCLPGAELVIDARLDDVGRQVGVHDRAAVEERDGIRGRGRPVRGRVEG